MEWDDICKPIEEGGLGLRDCKIWNTALLLVKVLWDIHVNKNTLWIKWIHAVYLRGKNICIWTNGRDDHPVFKKLIKIRNLLVQRTGSIAAAINLLSSWLSNGSISASKAYDWMRIKGVSKPWMRLVWKRYIPPKHSFILWLAMRRRLHTKDPWSTETADQIEDAFSVITIWNQ